MFYYIISVIQYMKSYETNQWVYYTSSSCLIFILRSYAYQITCKKKYLLDCILIDLKCLVDSFNFKLWNLGKFVVNIVIKLVDVIFRKYWITIGNYRAQIFEILFVYFWLLYFCCKFINVTVNLFIGEIISLIKSP